MTARASREHASYLDGPEAIPRPLAVQLGPPQRLVGVDVADTRDQGLVEQQPLDAGRTTPHPRDEQVVVELRVERVARDVGDLRGQLRASRRDRQAAEHPLVDEAKLAVAETEAHAQVALVGVARLLDQD